MSSEQTEKSRSFMHYAALKTAIVNGEEDLVKQLLTNQTMPQLEQSYLLDLAKLNGNPVIIALLEAIPQAN